jgi:hypothetical protein
MFMQQNTYVASGVNDLFIHHSKIEQPSKPVRLLLFDRPPRYKWESSFDRPTRVKWESLACLNLLAPCSFFLLEPRLALRTPKDYYHGAEEEMLKAYSGVVIGRALYYTSWQISQ